MKILSTHEAKNAFPKVLKLSRRDVVIVTNRGKPVAAIRGLSGEQDLEDYRVGAKSEVLGDDSEGPPRPQREHRPGAQGPRSLMAHDGRCHDRFGL